LKLSITAPTSHPDELLGYAKLVQSGLFHRLWLGHQIATDSLLQLSFLAGSGIRVPVGLGVSLAPLRHPYQAAHETRSLAALIGHSVEAAYGPGAKEFQAALVRQSAASPLTAMREYLTIMRGLLDGDVVDEAGRYYVMRGGLVEVSTPRVHLGLGVLRSGMAALAGSIADSAVTWLASPRNFHEVLGPAWAGGERPLPEPLRVVATAHVAVQASDRNLYELVHASTAQHLKAPHYRQVLAASGVDLSGPPTTVAASMIDNRCFLAGSFDEVVSGVDAYARAGVDELVLNPLGVAMTAGHDRAVAELRELAVAVGCRASGG
jgi:alkanesulfonate monooxygenase SsuD/methylene tetrahydromethanopterin reductase-like flavin-dependent oxidoreductase (luciferase family)